ncbi:MAG: glycogen debranching N-terminal domain-containing protein, partial [Actinomycetota bacterium]
MADTDPVLDIREAQVIKDDRTFLVTDRLGDVPEGNTAALGLYHKDTRFLSGLELHLNDRTPLLLHSSTERNYSQVVELTYPFESIDQEGIHRKENVSVQRHRVLAGSLFERIRVRNFGSKTRALRLVVDFDADFLDVFEVRGLVREQTGQRQPPRVERSTVVLAHRGRDGSERTTTLRFSPAPAELDDSRAVFQLDVGPMERTEVAVEVVPSVDGHRGTRVTMADAEDRVSREYTRWKKRCTRFTAANVQLQQ